MSLYDEIEAIECEQCRALAIEDMAEFAANPENLARLDPEEAEEMRQYLGKVLNRPDDSLQQLVRALASKARSAVGNFEN